jgi:hypothetical protein
MRVFITSCLVAVIVAIGAAFVLNTYVQEPSSAAFAESSARI